MASGSEVAHLVLSGGFLSYVLLYVEDRNLETSCLKYILGYNLIVFLIGQEFGV